MQYQTWFIFHSLEVIVTGKISNASATSVSRSFGSVVSLVLVLVCCLTSKSPGMVMSKRSVTNVTQP